MSLRTIETNIIGTQQKGDNSSSRVRQTNVLYFQGMCQSYDLLFGQRNSLLLCDDSLRALALVATPGVVFW